MDHPGVEVVTTLGDTCLERTVVGNGARIGDMIVRARPAGFVLRRSDGTEQALPARLPYGLGAIEIRAVVNPRARKPNGSHVGAAA